MPDGGLSGMGETLVRIDDATAARVLRRGQPPRITPDQKGEQP